MTDNPVTEALTNAISILTCLHAGSLGKEANLKALEDMHRAMAKLSEDKAEEIVGCLSRALVILGADARPPT